MATKPLVSTEWATQVTTAGASGNINKDEPTQAFKDFGQPEASPVDRQSLNYELNALDQWRAYFETTTDELTAGATTTVKGLVELATAAELDVGTDTSRVVPVKTLSDKLKTYQEKDFIVVSGGGTLSINRTYIITDNEEYTLPAVAGLTNKDRVTVMRTGVDVASTLAPLINVEGVVENIKLYDPKTGILLKTDQSLKYNVGFSLTFLHNNTNWEV